MLQQRRAALARLAAAVEAATAGFLEADSKIFAGSQERQRVLSVSRARLLSPAAEDPTRVTSRLRSWSRAKWRLPLRGRATGREPGIASA